MFSNFMQVLHHNCKKYQYDVRKIFTLLWMLISAELNADSKTDEKVDKNF